MDDKRAIHRAKNNYRFLKEAKITGTKQKIVISAAILLGVSKEAE